jgi:hypothetical protein
MAFKGLKFRFLALVISSSFILGCSTFRYLDGSTENEVTSFCTGKQVNAMGETPEMERRRKEIEQKADEIAQKEASLEKAKEEEKAELMNQIGFLKEDVSELEQQIAALEAENTKLKQSKGPLTAISARTAPLRIKVLSGNGSLLSAKQTAARLRKMGYAIDRTDLAPSTAFPREKVFFAKGYESEAKELARKLSSDSVSAPISWKSIFDIIVVTRNEKLNEE